VRIEGKPLGALHPLERAGHREGLAAERFQLGAGLEIVGRFLGTSQPGIGQAAEIMASRVAAAARDGGREQLVGAAIIAGEIGVDAPPVQLIQQRVLGPAH
jgi:hypothetical protein